MRKDVSDGMTLIISGPASAIMVEGKATVFGMALTVGRKLIVRRGKALPFEANGSTSLDIVDEDVRVGDLAPIVFCGDDCPYSDGDGVSWGQAETAFFSPFEFRHELIVGSARRGYHRDVSRTH